MGWTTGGRFATAAFFVTAEPLALAPLLAIGGHATTPVALGGLIFLGSAMHYAATGSLVTVQGVRQLMRRRPVRLVAAPVLAAMTSVVTMALVSSFGVDVVLYVFFAWQFFHYAKQNVGVASLTASGLRIRPLTATERHSLEGAGLAGVAAVIARGHLLELPTFPHATDLFVASGFVFFLAVTVGVRSLVARPARDRPLGFTFVYLSVLTFSLPVFLFGSPYAALSGLTIAHGLQYLLIVSLVATPRQWSMASVVRAGMAVVTVLAAAVLIHLSAHVPSSTGGSRLLFGAYLGVATAHFVFDATIWRMRDPRTRAVFASRLPQLVGNAAAPPVTPSYVADRYSSTQ